jgi:hypothetical protein
MASVGISSPVFTSTKTAKEGKIYCTVPAVMAAVGVSSSKHASTLLPKTVELGDVCAHVGWFQDS